MADNVIRAQTRIANEVAFRFEENTKLAKAIKFDNSLFNPADNHGETWTLRRPGKVATASAVLSARGSFPTVGAAPSYGNYTEPTAQLTITRKFRQAIPVSSQDLTLAITGKQMESRGILEGAKILARQVDQYLGGLMIAGSSQVLGTPGTPSTGSTALDQFVAAGALLDDRNVTMGERYAVIQQSMRQQLVTANRTLFNPNKKIADIWGTAQIGDFAGMGFASSSLLPGDKVTAPAHAITVDGAGQSAGAVWTQTWNLNIAGTTGEVVAAGTLFKITNTATDINWCIPDTFQDSGRVAVFRTLTDVTIADSKGTLVCTEPLIGPLTGAGGSTNGYQNVTALPANGATITLLNAVASAKPSLVFDDSSVIGCSPIISVPEEIWSKDIKLDNGLNIKFIKTVDTLNLTRIYELQCMVGLGIPLPEGIATVY